jgi:hypothetical protein
MSSFDFSVPIKKGSLWKRLNYAVTAGKIDSLPSVVLLSVKDCSALAVIEALTPTVVYGDDYGFTVVIQIHVILSEPVIQDCSLDIRIDIDGVTELIPANAIADGPRPGLSGSTLIEKRLSKLGYRAQGKIADVIGYDGLLTTLLISDNGGYKLHCEFLPTADNSKKFVAIGDFDEQWRLVFSTRHYISGASHITSGLCFSDLHLIHSEITDGVEKNSVDIDVETSTPTEPLRLDADILWPFRLATLSHPPETALKMLVANQSISPKDTRDDWLGITTTDVSVYEDSFPIHGSQAPILTWRYETNFGNTLMIAELGQNGEGIYRLRWNSDEFALYAQILESQ